MWEKWILTDWSAVGMAAVSTVAVYLGIIALVRASGLRSFSKMSAFDFAMTIALGSLFASTIASPEPPLLLSLAALTLLFLVQRVVAVARESALVKRALDNSPLLLMLDGRPLRENLRRARVTEDDLRARLREAGVLSYREVRAVVFETTGDVSVLTGEGELDPDLLRDVDRGEAAAPERDRGSAMPRRA